MDRDRIEGAAKEIGGKAKEEWGDLTDSASTEVEGKLDQAEGKIQHEWGKAKDKADDDR